MKKMELLLVMFMLAINVSYGQGLHVHRKDGKVIKMKVENVDSISFSMDNMEKEENISDTVVVVKKDTIVVEKKDTIVVEKKDTIVQEKIVYVTEDGKPICFFYYAKGEESNYNIPTTVAEFNSLVSQGKATKQAVSDSTYTTPDSALNCSGYENYWWVAIPKAYSVSNIYDVRYPGTDLRDNFPLTTTKEGGAYHIVTTDYIIYYTNSLYPVAGAYKVVADKN